MFKFPEKLRTTGILLASVVGLVTAGFIGASASASALPGEAAVTYIHNPYVLVEFSHSASGIPQPMVISPSGRALVNSRGEILNSSAGQVGQYTQTDGLQEAINYAVGKGLDVYIVDTSLK